MAEQLELRSPQTHEKGAVEDTHSLLLKEVFPSKSIIETNSSKLQEGHLSLGNLWSRPETYSASALTDSVIREYGAGMYNHVKDNPVRIGMEVGVGAVAAFAWNSIYVPRVRTAVEAAGAAYGLYQLGKAGMNLFDQAATLSNSDSSQLALDEAKQNIRKVGAGTVDVLALTAGGVLGNEAGRVMVNLSMRSSGLSTMPEYFSATNWKSSAITSANLIGIENNLIPGNLSGLVGRWVREADTARTRK